MNPGGVIGPGRRSSSGIRAGRHCRRRRGRFPDGLSRTLFLLLTVGAFWVGSPFLIKALALIWAGRARRRPGRFAVLFPLLFRRASAAPKSGPGSFSFPSCPLRPAAGNRRFPPGYPYLQGSQRPVDRRGLSCPAAGLAGFRAGRLVCVWIGRRFCRGGGSGGCGTARSPCSLFLAAVPAGQRGLSAGRKRQRSGERRGTPESDRRTSSSCWWMRCGRITCPPTAIPLPTSPAIDRLAREGVLFRNCYRHLDLDHPDPCLAFHGTFSLPSMAPIRCIRPWIPAIPTLAKILAARGYRTAAFYDNPLLGFPLWAVARISNCLGRGQRCTRCR